MEQNFLEGGGRVCLASTVKGWEGEGEKIIVLLILEENESGDVFLQ